MTDDTAKDNILSALRAYHGGNIYLMGTPGLVAAGFELHNENEVSSIEWAKNFTCLHVRIGKAGRVVVNVRLKDEKPVFSCTCSRGMREGGCEHTVCAVLVIKNLLMPEVFKPKKPKPVYRKALLAGLVGDSPAKLRKTADAGYSVVLEQQEQGSADVYVVADGERVSKFAELLRSPLADFAGQDLTFHQKIDALIRFLKRNGGQVPFVLKLGENDFEPSFDPELSLETFTEFALSGDEVSVIKSLRDKDGQTVPFVFFSDLIYLPEASKLAIVENSEGWEAWESLHHELKKAGQEDRMPAEASFCRFSLPVPLFDALHQAFLKKRAGKDREKLLYTVNGNEALIARTNFEPRLTIALPEPGGNSAVLKAESVSGASVRPVTDSRFRFFDSLSLLPPYLRTEKRREILIQAFFTLLEQKTKVHDEKIIAAALNDGGIERADMRDEARRFLLRNQGDSRSDSAEVLVQAGQWKSVSRDGDREALLLKVLYEVFGCEVFNNMERGDIFSLPLGLFHERLDVLCDRLSGFGINLYLKGKPVRQARWEISIDATRKKGIDWFELRPEIRCDGKALEKLSMDRLLTSEHRVLENDDCIQILDAHAYQVIGQLAAAYRVVEDKNKGGREIVKVPRLRILDWIALRTGGVTVKLGSEDEEILRRLLDFQRIERKPLPRGLRAKLRSYQQEGYDWLAFLYEHRFGACLADDMGLGKTVQAIAFLGGIKEGSVKSVAGSENLPHLIVLPPSLVFNWEQELRRFCPGLKLHIYTGPGRSEVFDGYDVVLTTYGTVRQDIEKLKNRQFHVIVFDEAQSVKNLHADTTGAVRQLSGLFKVTMTGTPVENHLGEYYSVVDLAVPGLLGEYDRFKPLIKSGASADLELIIRRTRPFVLRRTKEAVLRDLPAKTETDIHLDLTEEQKILYQKTVEQVRSAVDEAYETKTQSQARIIALTAILKLRQICISPQLLDQDLAGVSPKMDFLIEQLRELMEENHSALVFSQFTSFLDILGEALDRENIGYLRLDGSTPMGRRKTLVNQFQAGEGPAVFLLSLKAGGQGLNLTKASYVFHLDPWWNPAVENQASDRAHRIGQKNKVTITRILMRHTIEEKMMELKKRKRALYDAILGGEGADSRGLSISKADFQYLLG